MVDPRSTAFREGYWRAFRTIEYKLVNQMVPRYMNTEQLLDLMTDIKKSCYEDMLNLSQRHK